MILGGLADIARERQGRRRRVSSWDRNGGNFDFLIISPGQTATLCDIEGGGVVRHIWCTIAAPGSAHYPRTTVLRMWWDDAASPCVEAPIGDFFGIGHGMVRNFWSLPLSMSPRGRPWLRTASSPCPSPGAPASRSPTRDRPR